MWTSAVTTASGQWQFTQRQENTSVRLDSCSLQRQAQIEDYFANPYRKKNNTSQKQLFRRFTLFKRYRITWSLVRNNSSHNGCEVLAFLVHFHGISRTWKYSLDTAFWNTGQADVKKAKENENSDRMKMFQRRFWIKFVIELKVKAKDRMTVARSAAIPQKLSAQWFRVTNASNAGGWKI